MNAHCYPAHLLEHVEVLNCQFVYKGFKRMKWVQWNEVDVSPAVKRIKNGKQPGPDLIKGEIIKWLIESKICLKFLTSAMNGVVISGAFPSGWRNSKTVMLPQEKKPNVDQLRPIALTNTLYKLLMSLIKDQLYDHLVSIGEINDLQAGFTKGLRMEDNVFLLDYCIRDSKKRKRELIVIALDFEKAFDSVDRRSLMKAIKKCKCDPLIIDVISRLYEGDTTEMFMGSRKIFETDVTNGIRQECTLSPLLFLLVVNRIIRKLQESEWTWI